jgi:hypothetical protein
LSLGEALSARNLTIASTPSVVGLDPIYFSAALAGSRRRRRHRAARVHISEAPFIAVLIGVDRGKNFTDIFTELR